MQVKHSGIIWTDPRDLTIDELVQLVKEGRVAHPGTAHVGEDELMVGFMDGSVHLLPRTMSAKTARAICTISGGEMIKPQDLKERKCSSCIHQG